jgi:hypothetical protein
MDQGVGLAKLAPGSVGARLCNLVAQGPRATEERI